MFILLCKPINLKAFFVLLKEKAKEDRKVLNNGNGKMK